MGLNALSDELQRLLDERIAERRALLLRAEAVVRDDVRIDAAWIGGSIGRNSDDALSDIDLHVSVADELIDEVVAARHSFPFRIETPILTVEEPQNNPVGGTFLITLYAGQNGPQQIDWNFHCRSRARLATETRILFERLPVPRIDESELRWDYQPIPELTPAGQAVHSVNSFWMLLLITAKAVARHPSEPEMPLLVYVVESLRRVRAYIDPTSVTQATAPDGPGPAAARLRLLRDLAARMEAAMPEVSRRGRAISPDIVSAADRYLSLVERIVAPSDNAR